MNTVNQKYDISLAGEPINVNFNKVLCGGYSASLGGDLYKAWGVEGVAAMGYFTASIMSTRIRQRQSFPFLALDGHPGSGKSTLLEFLWKLMGINRRHEGIDPSVATSASLLRAFTGTKNLPVVLINDRSCDQNERFDWTAVKACYSGNLTTKLRPTASEAMSSRLFDGTLIILGSQAASDEAMLSRQCQLFLNRDNQSQCSHDAVRRLENASIDSLSGYLGFCVQNIDQLSDMFFSEHKRFLNEAIDYQVLESSRVIHNHAQLAAAVSCLALVTDIDPEVIRKTQNHIMGPMALALESKISKEATHEH